jgi:hypothetical protein
MRKKDMQSIRDATALAFAAQVRRDLDIAKAKGWKFPDGCEVAVKVIEANALEARIHARIDDVGGMYTLAVDSTAGDIVAIVGQLTKSWLEKKGTAP